MNECVSCEYANPFSCASCQFNPARGMRRFPHGCTSCRFLGNDEHHDLYHCPNCESDMGGTLLARYGSEDSHYLSSPVSIVERINAQGWLSQEGKVVPGSDESVQNYALVKALHLLKGGR